MNSWQEFKKNKPEPRPEGMQIGGVYRCQFCPDIVMGGTYFPQDQVLKYKCKDDHLNFIEDFKVAF